MLDDPRKPFDELLTPKNVYDRVSALETKQTEPSAKAGSNEELANTTGTQVVGNLLSPAPGVESTDPTDSAFTGSFMSGDGYAFNNEAYNMGGVNAGTLQWGAKQDDGTLEAGAGKVTLDADGVRILTPSTGFPSDAAKIKFVEEASPTNTIANIYSAQSATNQSLYVFAESKTGVDSSVLVSADSPTGEVSSIALYTSINGNASGKILITGVAADTGEININADGDDVDTIIQGDTAANLLVIDAGLDAVQIGTTTAADIMDARSGSVVFNENSRDMDFRVESNGVANMLLIDGGADTISMNNINVTPATNSFTPTVFGATSAGAGTYSTQLGEYFSIGKLVYFQITMIWTAHTGTGNFRVGGLPFTAANNGISVPVTVTWSNITLAAVGNKLLASVNPNTNNISLFEIGSGAISNLAIDTAATLSLSGMYIAA